MSGSPRLCLRTDGRRSWIQRGNCRIEVWDKVVGIGYRETEYLTQGELLEHGVVGKWNQQETAKEPEMTNWHLPTLASKMAHHLKVPAIKPDDVTSIP